MPILNFKPQFADLIQSGQKCQTIRPVRKHPIKKGDILYLYTGLRTKYSKKLAEARCTAISPIQIGSQQVWLNDVCLPIKMIDSLAKQDGFKDEFEFFDFFHRHYSLPFSGYVIYWAIK